MASRVSNSECLSGFTSVLGQSGSSSVQDQYMEQRNNDSNDKDAIYLLVKEKSLELRMKMLEILMKPSTVAREAFHLHSHQETKESVTASWQIFQYPIVRVESN